MADLISLLNKHQFAIRRKLGEGGFRKVYEVLKFKGEAQKVFVGKIYSPAPPSSVFHKISCSKGNLEQREIDLLHNIDHPNIILIHQLLQEGEINVIVEEHFNATSLEDKVRIQGPIRNQEFLQNISSQIMDALRYLHVDAGVLHRDLKPSNFLLGRTADVVKVADFQTAILLSDVENKMLPTRGGTKYTHPDFINHLLTGSPSSASIATEFYALGATLFYLLTGNPPFAYNLNIVDEGIPLQIGEETIYIALEDGKEQLDCITYEEHEARLHQELEKVPMGFRELFLNCLSLERDRYSSLSAQDAHDVFRKDLDYALEQSFLPTEIIDSSPFQPGLATPETNAAIEKIVGAVISYGKREKETYSNHHGWGSDRILTNNSKEIYSLTSGERRYKFIDEADYHSFGTWSPGWSERYNRYLEIAEKGKIICQANRVLEGVNGRFYWTTQEETRQPIQAHGWFVK